ncbi:MAG: ATP-binding protein, partial [Anaerolineae bacterium]
ALPFDTLRHLGYIVEEALVNVWKHANCQAAWVAIETQSEQIEVIIGDDGEGFDPAAVAAWPEGSKGWGLENIRERAQQVGGRCQIESAPGQGTRVLIQIPLQAEPGDAGRNPSVWEDVWRLFGF